MLNCPSQAISETPRPIGLIEVGLAENLSCVRGVLQVGEAMATPVIRALKRYAHDTGWDRKQWLILDAPPGTSCPVIETLRGADVALLVTEPTPFGLHDLRLAARVARDTLHLPIAVVINKDCPDSADTDMEQYCQAANLPVLLRVPLSREIATAYSTGQPLVRAFAEYRPLFQALLDDLSRLVDRNPS